MMKLTSLERIRNSVVLVAPKQKGSVVDTKRSRTRWIRHASVKKDLHCYYYQVLLVFCGALVFLRLEFQSGGVYGFTLPPRPTSSNRSWLQQQTSVQVLPVRLVCFENIPIIHQGPLFQSVVSSIWARTSSLGQCNARYRTLLQSSFFDKFEEEELNKKDDDDNDDDDEDEEDEDEDDDDELLPVDDSQLDDFRSRMTNLFADRGGDSGVADELVGGYSSSASSSDTTSREGAEAKKDWAMVASTVGPGCLLVANPAAFLSDYGKTSGEDDLDDEEGTESNNSGRSIFSSFLNPSAASKTKKIRQELLAKFGLATSPPWDLGPDRQADLLPVLMIVEQVNQSTRAVLLNRRTGYLLGDLGQQQSGGGTSLTPLLDKFCIQPLWFGGVDSDASSGSSSGLEMLHQCPAVLDAVQITDDGLFWGGNPVQAQDAMGTSGVDFGAAGKTKVYSGFDFKFFVQSTVYPAPALQQELAQGTFFAVRTSKDILFKSRDRMGTYRAKPLWTEIMELLGGDFISVKNKLYGISDTTPPSSTAEDTFM